MEKILLAILASWTASVLSFPTVPFQHWLNSRLRSAWRFLTFRPRGLTGRWLANFELERPGQSERRIEMINASQLSGGEVRGTIKDRSTGNKYRFLGRIVFDEFVAHYWSTDEMRDIGTFKLQKGDGGKILFGMLTVVDTKAGKTRPGIVYTWHYQPSRIVLYFKPVRRGQSLIEGAGLFANDEFNSAEKIGRLDLGKVVPQGRHTIKFKNEHREVKKSWRFLNHACEPNAELVWLDDAVELKAKSRILPQTEVTIDYRVLPEPIGTSFQCNCLRCQTSRQPTMIGVA